MKQPKVNFYNLAWRWHFYAGLFVAPFMVMLALTGIDLPVQTATRFIDVQQPAQRPRRPSHRPGR